jgi:hypothetical protein
MELQRDNKEKIEDIAHVGEYHKREENKRNNSNVTCGQEQ